MSILGFHFSPLPIITHPPELGTQEYNLTSPLYVIDSAVRVDLVDLMLSFNGVVLVIDYECARVPHEAMISDLQGLGAPKLGL